MLRNYEKIEDISHGVINIISDKERPLCLSAYEYNASELKRAIKVQTHQKKFLFSLET